MTLSFQLGMALKRVRQTSKLAKRLIKQCENEQTQEQNKQKKVVRLIFVPNEVERNVIHNVNRLVGCVWLQIKNPTNFTI